MGCGSLCVVGENEWFFGGEKKRGFRGVEEGAFERWDWRTR